jgi:hypothetical protein
MHDLRERAESGSGTPCNILDRADATTQVEAVPMSNVPTHLTVPRQAGKHDALALRRPARIPGVVGRVRGAHRGERRRSDHPRPADPVAEMSDLPTTRDLAESGSRPVLILR